MNHRVHLHLPPRLGANLLEFCRDHWNQRTKIPWVILWHCLQDSMFRLFSRTPNCDK